MDRRNFIQAACVACMGGIAITSLLESCGASKYITATINGSDLIVPLSQFQTTKNNRIQFRKYLIVQNDSLKYPICIYRLGENKYSALWMQCTHQSAELQVFGDKLQCPAHGSEFSNTGAVTNPPATRNLKTFPITQENNQLKISLR